MKSNWIVGAAVAAMTLAAGGGALAQERIGENQSVQGRLESRDPVSSTGGRFDRYRLTAFPGEQVVLMMQSTDGVDPYVQIGRSRPGAGFQELASDDDGTGTLDSLLVFTAQEGGEYEVRATSFGSDQFGSYILSRSSIVPTLPGAGQGEYGISYLPIAVGGYIDFDDPVDADGRYYESFQFVIPAQHVVRIRLESQSMDPYVVLGLIDATGQYANLFYDDDSGGGLNSEFHYQSVAEDVFEVRATTYGAGGTGDYTLYVEDVSATSGGGLPSGVAVGGWLTDDDYIDTDGSRYEERTFYATRGQTVTVTQRSDLFDSYLTIGTGTGDQFRELISDDDSGGGTTGFDAQAVFTAPSTGLYTARVGSYSPDGSGLFSLQVDLY